MLNAKMIGDKIAEARKKINLSQAQLAEQLFISAQAVGKWERGESMPDIVTLNRLAEIIGTDLNYFAGREWKEARPGEFGATPTDPAGTEEPRRWDMSKGNWVDADFSGLKNLHEKFGSSNIQRCSFVGSDLSGLLLGGNHVQDCDFSRSDISRSNVKDSHLSGNQFNDCTLINAEFSGSHVSRCDLSGADFTGMTFKSGGFEKNTVAGAVWKRTTFTGSYLSDIVFEGQVEDCSFENCAFKKVQFQGATLVNTFFKNRSLKQVRFADCKADRLTYEFLKNGKADLTGLTLLAG